MSEKTHEVEVLPTLEMSECPQDFQVSIRNGFGAFMQQADELITKGRAIAAAEESPEQEKAARETRLALVKIRTGAEKLHKEMKAGILTQGRAIDGAKNIVIAATEPTEKELKAIEDRAERRAEEARLKLHTERKAELNQYTTAFDTISLGRLSEDEYANMLNGAKLAHEARIEQERKAAEDRAAAEAAAKAEQERLEAERIERERIAEEERKRIAEENARLKAEREKEDAERKRLEDEQALIERKRQHARSIIAHIKEVGTGMIGGKPQPFGILLHELESKIVIDDKMGDLQEEVRTIRDATYALLNAAMEKQSAERERQAEADRLAKVEADRIAAEKAEQEAKEAAAKKAALAPDKEKIAAYATAIKNVTLPTGSTEKGVKALIQAGEIVDRALAEIRTIYTALK